MCGRYTQRRSWSELVRLYRITDSPERPNLPPRYNIAPTEDVPAVRIRPSDEERELVLLRWGLVPSWAKDIDIGARMINARAETVAEKPSFRNALKRRRCLVVTDGFYEWQKQPQGPKQPYWIALKGEEPFAFAGLWERWDRAPDGNALETCTIITTGANELLRPVHDRMPVILPPDAYEVWLDVESYHGREVADLLRPYPSEALMARPVSRRVNNVANDDPDCIEPVGTEGATT